MVISARHLLATRANLRIAHERQHEKVLWEEEHGSCRKCNYDNDHSPVARCNDCINGGGKLDIYTRKQKKNKRRQIGYESWNPPWIGGASTQVFTAPTNHKRFIQLRE
jgi:hypothetical protein